MDNENVLAVLSDRMDISETVIRYATGVDMHDWVLFRSCFTDEVDIDITSFRGGSPFHMTAEDWTASVSAGISRYKAVQHLSSNHVITLNGDDATCVSYMQARHYFPLESSENCFMIGGYYTNTLVRTRLGWKIRKMVQTVTFTEGDRSQFEQYRLS